jgi:D-alanyl-D-alanine dipeptidase
MGYKFLYNVVDTYLELDMCEEENPPVLVKDDKANIFFNFKDIPNYLVRKQIYDMLVEASARLPKGLHFWAFEIYRPLKLQIQYWEEVVARMKVDFPNATQEEIEKKSEIYIAHPYKEGSGHQTGAAIDLTLCDDNGKLLDMGTEWRENVKKTATYSTELTKEQYENRNILLSTMIRSGFTNYFEEWWHYCYGELEWAVMTRIGKTKFLKLKV